MAHERVINLGTSSKPRWVVLDSNMRDVEYTGKDDELRGTDSFEDCMRYVRSVCPTGKCED